MINFNKPAALNFANKGAAATGTDKPKAQVWINVGYPVEVQLTDNTVETRFVSLATGIPVDTQEKLPTSSRNQEFAAFQAARNNLHEQIMAAAEKLAPGEEKLLNLSIQLRRVNDEMEAVSPDQNLFVKALVL